ncbi:adenylate cyclase [Oceanobacillus limi]|uniref:Adenylate cyclase n=1 Tax=Oceanobacillus limi TaxID=930131 RepID=A0A1I0C8N3_9BACI|nr:adenylate cyclase [Oceanobacillus limi]
MQEIEIEFKNILTRAEYHKLLNHFPFPNKGKIQTNFYFETKDFALRKQKSALRIRKKDGAYRLTLKEPHPQGLLETHDILTNEEAKAWISGNCIPKKYTAKQLNNLNIEPSKLIYYGQLTTERYEYKKDDLLYVLDYCTYNNHEDYELELEAKDETNGSTAFQSLLREFKIPKRETPNKIQRFFETLKL